MDHEFYIVKNCLSKFVELKESLIFRAFSIDNLKFHFRKYSKNEIHNVSFMINFTNKYRRGGTNIANLSCSMNDW